MGGLREVGPDLGGGPPPITSFIGLASSRSTQTTATRSPVKPANQASRLPWEFGLAAGRSSWALPPGTGRLASCIMKVIPAATSATARGPSATSGPPRA